MITTTKLEVPYRWRTTFVVEGTGMFPYDMLRYDSCTPRYQRDVSIMLESGQRKVELVRVHEGKKPPITDERWASFGWRVVRRGAGFGDFV